MSNSPVTSTSTIDAQNTKSFRSELVKILGTGVFADLHILCGERRWNVHRVVLCSQSVFFLKACSGEFEEASTRTIELQDEDGEVIDGMIQFFYNGDYEDKKSRTHPALFNSKMFTAADKFLSTPLKKKAYEKFVATFTLEDAETRTAAAEIITHVFTSTFETTKYLRDYVGRTFFNEIYINNDSRELNVLPQEDIRQAINDHGNIGLRILDEIERRWVSGYCSSCEQRSCIVNLKVGKTAPNFCHKCGIKLSVG